MVKVILGMFRRLGWYYGLAFAVAFSMLWAFAHLADEVLERDTSAFDQAVLLWLRAHSTSWADGLSLGLAVVGSPAGILLFTLVGAIAFARKRRVLDAVTLGLASGGAAILTYSLKRMFNLPRPALWSQMVFEPTASFPSGHSLLAWTLLGFVGVWVVLENPRERWRWGVAAVCFLGAALVGLSRAYLGVHWPSDILAGSIVATFWLAVCFIGRQWIAQGGHKRLVRRPGSSIKTP
jgi:undecaprenyl-diphosphatase